SELASGVQTAPLLAASIERIGQHVEGGGDLDDLLRSLDGGAPPFNDASVTHSALAASVVSDSRLYRSSASVVAQLLSNLCSPEGQRIAWAPLVGLKSTAPVAFGRELDPMIIPLDGNDVLSLEERDITRDFVAQVQVRGEEIATLVVAAPKANFPDAPS